MLNKSLERFRELGIHNQQSGTMAKLKDGSHLVLELVTSKIKPTLPFSKDFNTLMGPAIFLLKLNFKT